MRKVSKILVLVLVLALTACCIAALTACVDNNPTENPDDNKPDATKNYVFHVVDENNDPVQGVRVQLCIPGDDGSCFLPVETDEKGYAVFDGDTVANQVLDIHLLLGDNGNVLINGEESKYTFDNNSLQTTDSYGMIEIYLQLAD